MTNETQPKPEQVWRDLPKECGGIEGDRWIEVHTSQWSVEKTALWQRPVTPGQCDCAGLREAAQAAASQLRATGYVFFPTLIEDALAKPCTCAGKSAEETVSKDLYDDIYDQFVAAMKERDNARRKLAEAEDKMDDMRNRAVREFYAQEAPTWRSYATPPTEQDGVDIIGFGKAILHRYESGGIRLMNPVHCLPIRGCMWAPITLPQLPQKPEQDADEALVLAEKLAQIEWSGRHTLNTCMELSRERMIEMARTALDFARNQERK